LYSVWGGRAGRGATGPEGPCVRARLPL